MLLQFARFLVLLAFAGEAFSAPSRLREMPFEMWVLYPHRGKEVILGSLDAYPKGPNFMTVGGSPAIFVSKGPRKLYESRRGDYYRVALRYNARLKLYVLVSEKEPVQEEHTNNNKEAKDDRQGTAASAEQDSNNPGIDKAPDARSGSKHSFRAPFSEGLDLIIDLHGDLQVVDTRGAAALDLPLLHWVGCRAGAVNPIAPDYTGSFIGLMSASEKLPRNCEAVTIRRRRVF